MNGILVIKKEPNFTSFDCVAIAKKIFDTRRVGHAGTLDPLAEGVLIICVNEATKLVPYLEADSKTYVATVCIGKATNTYDLEGEVTETKDVVSLLNEEVDNVLRSFIGKITQVPPIFSAIKVNGRKLYDYARNNQLVDVPARDVEIFDIKRLNDVSIKNRMAFFDIECNVSKGTYIRSLCFDIAKKLGYPGLMEHLVRTRSGRFSIEDAVSTEEFKKGNVKLLGMCEALDYDQIDNPELSILCNDGKIIGAEKVRKILGFTPNKIVIKHEDVLQGIYGLDEKKNLYKGLRIWK